MSDVNVGWSPGLLREAERAAAALRRAKEVLIVTHIDADGITAGAIAAQALNRLGKPCTLDFEKKIATETVQMINCSSADMVWVCDLGSAYISQFTRTGIIVTDHHVPDPGWRQGQTSLDGFSASFHLNPHLWGRSGSTEASGAGMTYLLAKTIDPANADLAYLAVIGAVGDFQDTASSQLTGWNRLILQDAVAHGDVVCEQGLRYFGRETRPLIQFLQYGSEPRISGVTDDRDGCVALLAAFRIPIRMADGRLRTWNDLGADERAVLADDLLSRLPAEKDRQTLFGEVYKLPHFAAGTGLRDAKEFATILNSCGRYDDASTGARLCCGDLTALADAERNRAEHRRNISAALSLVKDGHLIRERRYLQWFDVGAAIQETVVGSVAGMLLNADWVRSDLPIIAFAQADDGIKVSARASRELTDKGLNLAEVMNKAAAAVGGMGGGHPVAAGATIPPGKEEVFLNVAEDEVAQQLSRL